MIAIRKRRLGYRHSQRKTMRVYVNRKMRPVETISGMRNGGGDKEERWRK
jgi:hypothetical protein